ncbi:hypothetical protein A2130_03325 [Candidatus Woesebacteria bacterium GWC2_33_12]|uniref:DUF1003 domain-containing protein n=1 Tax=Candidatus Woesebacteria bacterium GW2011_GWB1_33_22 TaxID=1618566 RepID=A0A0G0BZV7_9BACT|nr:MAG: hypothetical protein UR29_C0004G0030 [Candidatus Woesebacteria bacterium GW2011_GWC2_33_12]KKP41896.1 MAG: hypothetical protein UR33_C0008G0015 [Candidatus Woesebacteria bacterium GW2011_GWA2_33_20]KKP44470.1 MAG: hypothetical protein UR35_C0008G0015 [Candidatus Woesebacteria bacterium GW2011_GWB1_33_22]KKP46320.1 MAG: hypothetical protein UR37_C0009G0015 [Microgenomates group bacterium GW2011_GWC1_33_28]KKP50417.1 MAG: hypothetical protein UR41_C0008G0015 [Candidatus Woesebacteria bact
MSRIVQSFEAKELKKRPFIIKIADRLTSFFGSISFLILNLLFFVSWIIFNKFDKFPFPMLTMIVSLEAIFLTIVMLVSQQRQTHIATIREELDMQINKYSEREITKILNLLKLIAEKQGVKLEDKELDEMLNELELGYIERKLEEQLTSSQEH